MEELPNNSKTRRDEVEPTEPRVTRVVSGDVEAHKPGLGKRFRNTFLGGHAKGTATFVWYEVLVPAARDMIADAGRESLERIIYPDGGRPRGRTSPRYSSGTHVNYRGVSDRDRRDPRDRDREPSRRARQNHDFREFIIDTRHEAVTVLEQMYEIISVYGQCTVSDFYHMLGVVPDWPDEKFGWREGDLRGSSVRSHRGGYLVDVPPPIELN